MRTLQFKVSGQSLSKNGDFSGIVAGTKGYLRLYFDFDPEWAGCKKAVIFSRYDREQALPVINGGCPVPDEIAQHSRWKVRLIGEKKGYRITTNEVEVRQS